jgi:hypothetical protein
MMATQDVNIKLKAVDETKAAFKSAESSLQNYNAALLTTRNAIFAVVAATAAMGKAIIGENVGFQKLEASLKTFTGSAENATKAFDALSYFASTTPFGLDEVVGGFNKLIARGIAPTIEQLTSFGNIAAGTGKTFDQFVEAIADASVGEFERLKEFGIKANQQGNSVQMTFGGVTTTIAKDSTSIINYLTKLGDTKFAGAMELQANTLGGAFSGLKDQIQLLFIEIGKSGLNDWVVDVTKSLTTLIKTFNDAGKAGLGFFDSIELNRTIADIGADSAIVKYTERLEGLKVALGRDNMFKGVIQKEIDSIERKLQLLKAEPVAPELPEIKVTATKIVEELKSVSQAYDAVGQAIAGSDLIKAQNLAQSVEKLDELFFNGAINADLYESAMKKLTNTTSTKGADATQALRDYARAAQDVGKSMVSLQLGAIRSLEDSFIGLINGTMSVKDAFASMATSIVNDLIRIMVQQSITGPIAQALGYANPYGGAQQQPSGDFVGPLPARAIGGPVQAGQPYMVGERGPEMFVPSQGGSIVPNNNMGSGSVVVNQTINVTTGVQQTVRAEIMSLMPQISNAAKAAVADAKLRGGSYGKMMA